jgi:sulfofructose kinase
LQTFQREGVDCSQVRILPEARPICAIVIVEQPTGRRCILFSHEGFMPPGPDQVTEELISSCKVLFVDHTVLPVGTRAARLARQLGIPVVVDIEPVNDLSSLSEFISAVDHLIIGIELARQLTRQHDPQAIVSALSCPERVCTVVTAGDQGCWYAERCGPVNHFPAFSMPVVDTTGCGDVFHGAYAAALSRGEPIKDAIQVATAAAGIKATKAGGQPGIPDLETIRRFLQDHLPSS